MKEFILEEKLSILRSEIRRLDDDIKIIQQEKSLLDDEKRELLFKLEEILIKENNFIKEEKLLKSAVAKNLYKMLKISVKLNIAKRKNDILTFSKDPLVNSNTDKITHKINDNIINNNNKNDNKIIENNNKLNIDDNNNNTNLLFSRIGVIKTEWNSLNYYTTGTFIAPNAILTTASNIIRNNLFFPDKI